MSPRGAISTPCAQRALPCRLRGLASRHWHIVAGWPAVLIFLVVLIRRLRRFVLLSRLPCLKVEKLTHSSLSAAAREHWPDGLVRLPGNHGVLVTSPALTRQLLERGDGAVHREVQQYVRYGGFLPGALVLLPQGSVEHRVLRSALLPLFTPMATRRNHATLLACTERLVARLAEFAAKRGERAAVPLYRFVQEYTLDVTCRAFLGGTMADADARRLIALFEEWLESPPPQKMAGAGAWGARGARHVRKAVGRLLGRPTDEEDHQRLLGVYEGILTRVCARMAVTEADLAAGQQDGAPAASGAGTDAPAASCAGTDAPSTRRPPSPRTVLGALRPLGAVCGLEMRQQAAGLLFAGLNSSKELHSMLALMAHHPQLQEEAHAELEAVLGVGDEGRAPTYEELSDAAASSRHGRTGQSVRGAEGDASAADPLPPAAASLEYCSRLVFEALRLSPGIEHLRLHTTRTVTVDSGDTEQLATGSGDGTGRNGRAGGRRIVLPEATRLVISPASLHHHPSHWPQPCDTPRPELFTPAAQAARSPGCFLPFSAGPKGCPAAGFALHEARMLLAMVLQRFQLSAADGGRVRVALRSSVSGEATQACERPPPA